MGVAEEIAALWSEVPKTGGDDYYATLLRKTMQSKKILVETGRPYSILPALRDLVRKRIVRVPAEHVGFLEISVFDLIANPVKKALQAYVNRFGEEDVALVEWFVNAAKKDTFLALDAKTLEEWVKQRGALSLGDAQNA